MSKTGRMEIRLKKYFWERRQTFLKYKIFIFENVFIREKQKPNQKPYKLFGY